MVVGDENSKLFQNYAKGRKNTNTIWGIKKEEGETTKYFAELALMGRNHFKNLFKYTEGVLLVEVIWVSQIFTCYVEEEENDLIMAPVSKGEIEWVLKSM